MTRKLLLTQICPIEFTTDACVLVGCEYCNVKLNELLDEYDKHVIEQYKASTNLKDTIREIHDNVAHEMYCKGIDDFAEKMKYEYGSDEIHETIDEIAEQLKAGGKNE